MQFIEFWKLWVHAHIYGAYGYAWPVLAIPIDKPLSKFEPSIPTVKKGTSDDHHHASD
jgi:hypothetical protein